MAQSSECTTVAVRYRYVFKRNSAGVKVLTFLPHKVRELKPDHVEFLDDLDYLRSLDPKDWKQQDHYRVLGIPTLRIDASDEIIRTAYRKKVLDHHPDKRKAKGADFKLEDDYFTCITMAYETLGDPKKRRSYDSVDPEFDNGLPSSLEIKNDFYGTFAYYFDLNARWSEKKDVPKFGGPQSTFKEVENFYNFWYDFKSWREFSYEDQENKDACSGREEKRHADKLNKAERARKKKEEMTRLRTLVDLAYKNDPRIAKFKQEEKNRKLEAKKAKQAALQKHIQDEQRVVEEAKLTQEKTEAEEKAKTEALRKDREAQKKALKKERKTLRDVCKSNNYFVENPDQNLKHITAVEKICETMNIEELKRVNEQIKNEGKIAFFRAAKLDYSSDKPKKPAETPKKTQNIITNGTHQETEGWNAEKMKYLAEALKMMPQGTTKRWKKVADFMNKHDKLKKDSGKFTPKMVSMQAKKVQNPS